MHPKSFVSNFWGAVHSKRNQDFYFMKKRKGYLKQYSCSKKCSIL